MFEKMPEKETVCARIKEFFLSVRYGMGNLNFTYTQMGSLTEYKCSKKQREWIQYVQLFVMPWTVTCQVRLSMGIFQIRIQEWIPIPFSSRSSRHPGIETWSPAEL